MPRATPRNWRSTAEPSPPPSPQVYAVNVGFNVVPVAGSFVDDGSGETDEEQKLRNESRKILHAPDLRCPAPACVCRSSPATVWPSTRSSRGHLARGGTGPAQERAGVVVADVPNPLEATGRDEVYVGRVRADQRRAGRKGLVLFVG